MRIEERKALWSELGLDYSKPIYDKETNEEFFAIGVNYIKKDENDKILIALLNGKYGDGEWVFAENFRN